ncbi:MAG: hypothetical protein NVS3B26_07020 [Mycobacteriales bacterium]
MPSRDLLDALIGVDVGPSALRWGSLATLLWIERCRTRDVNSRVKQFALAGLAFVPVPVVAAVAARHL